MFESLTDISSLSEMYAIYASLFLVMIHLVWIWNVEIQFISANQSLIEENCFSEKYFSTNFNSTANYPVIWIIKYVRRKLSSGDDEDSQLLPNLTR